MRIIKSITNRFSIFRKFRVLQRGKMFYVEYRELATLYRWERYPTARFFIDEIYAVRYISALTNGRQTYVSSVKWEAR